MKGAANISLSLDKIGNVEIPVPSMQQQIQQIQTLDNIDREILLELSKLDYLYFDKENELQKFKGIFS